MSDLDYTEVWKRLQLTHDFLCERKITPVNTWDCKDCDYFYQDPKCYTPNCLKEKIRDWTLYRLS